MPFLFEGRRGPPGRRQGEALRGGSLKRSRSAFTIDENVEQFFDVLELFVRNAAERDTAYDSLSVDDEEVALVIFHLIVFRHAAVPVAIERDPHPFRMVSDTMPTLLSVMTGPKIERASQTPATHSAYLSILGGDYQLPMKDT